MRVVSALFGSLMLFLGLLMLGFGLVGAVQAADASTPGNGDWFCSTGSGPNSCQYTVGSVPEEQLQSTSSLAVTVAGGSLAVCGAILLLIGSSRPQRAPVPAPGGPYGPPYGPPYSGIGVEPAT